MNRIVAQDGAVVELDTNGRFLVADLLDSFLGRRDPKRARELAQTFVSAATLRETLEEVKATIEWAMNPEIKFQQDAQRSSAPYRDGATIAQIYAIVCAGLQKVSTEHEGRNA